MKVIDILLEAEVPGGLSGKVARLILPAAARTWNAEKQAAFREAVKALEETIYLAKSQPIPLTVSNVDAYKVVQKAAPNHVTDKEFAQAVFTTADERAAQRIAAENAAYVSKAEADAETKAKADKEKSREEKIRAGEPIASGWRGTASQKTKFFLKWFGVPGYIAFDTVFNSYAEYAKNQEWALEQVKAKKMTVEQAKAYDATQKMALTLSVAATLAPVTPLLLKGLVSGSLKSVKWVVRTIRGTKAEEVPLEKVLSQARVDSVLYSTVLAAIAYMNSDGTYSTQNWSIYDSNNNEIGKVGRPLTFREILAYFAVNYSFGKDAVSAVADDLNAYWNEMMSASVPTQKQKIEKAAGAPVTPNVVSKPAEVVDGIRIHNR